MTQNDIVTLPNPTLRQTSQRIGVVDDEIRQLAVGLIEAMQDWEKTHPNELSAAIAAIQVAKPYRLVIIRSDRKGKKAANFSCYLNPEIVKQDGELAIDNEGCLSIPDIYGKVLRYPRVKVRAMTLDGEQVRITAEGFLARVFQHEVDHLTGKLFIDKVQNDRFYKMTEGGKLEPLKSDEITNYRLLWNRAG